MLSNEDTSNNQIRKFKPRKKQRRNKGKQKDNAECEYTNNSAQTLGKAKQRFNQAATRSKHVSEIDRIISRIKPSVETRDKCSLARHTECFMDVSTTPSKWLRLSKTNSLSLYPTPKTKRRRNPRDKKSSSQSSEREMTGDTGSIISDGQESEYDDICSFDSEVNLLGLTVTLEDKKRLEEVRLKSYASLMKKGKHERPPNDGERSIKKATSRK